MTSPGLKRPIELDPQQHVNVTGSGSSGTSPNGDQLANGNKRRCTAALESRYSLSSPFKDSTLMLNPLTEDVSAMIKDELSRVYDNHNCDVKEPPILTARQTQTICEKLIRDRERKLRDEYDRILALKLAEQYNLIAKANYLNSYVESTRLPPNVTASLPTPSSMNDIAAAFIQRSTVANNPSSAPTAAPDITSLAASLTANNHHHPSAITTSHLAFNLQQHAAAAALQAQQQQRTPVNSSALPMGPVLLASNLDEQLATPEALFTLFGVFGDVIRVKILFNKKDNALIQMAEASQAQVAQGFLDKQRVFGKIIRVTQSKHQLVQMPRDGSQSDAGLTKDFTNSPLHRFKIPGSRNYQNIYPPSNTLHISNIPSTIDESDLQKAFSEQCGFQYSSFKFFPKDRKMALMKFDSIEHATIALIKMHNFQISDENNLRVSFSKSVMQQ